MQSMCQNSPPKHCYSRVVNVTQVPTLPDLSNESARHIKSEVPPKRRKAINPSQGDPAVALGARVAAGGGNHFQEA